VSDNITLPRAVALHICDVLRGIINASDGDCGEPDCDDCGPVRAMKETVTVLNDALAEQKPEPAFQVDAERYRWLRGEVQGPHTPLAQVVWKRNNIRESGAWANLSDGQALDEAIDAALAEPPAKPEPVHPGYIIGSHWLETAYSRIAAGEAEAEVLTEVLGARGWVKPEPATDEQVAEADENHEPSWIDYRDGWKAAERWHGITKEDKT
jgi:hypothetical protein